MDPELVTTNKLNSDTIFSFINEAIDKFYKTRYSGINSKSEGFEQSQKRIDDLRSLVKTKKYTDTITNTDNQYEVELPNDYVMLLGDTAGIQPIDDYNDPCWGYSEDGDYIIKRNDTIEATIETIDRQLGNSLSEHRLKYCTARPLRLIQGNKIYLYTDCKYKVSEYTITYLSKPVLLDSKNITNTEYTSLPEHTHMEIVKMAVQLYLATKPMQHYSVYSTEVNNME
jgi:hypothetical protein